MGWVWFYDTFWEHTPPIPKLSFLTTKKISAGRSTLRVIITPPHTSYNHSGLYTQLINLITQPLSGFTLWFQTKAWNEGCGCSCFSTPTDPTRQGLSGPPPHSGQEGGTSSASAATEGMKNLDCVSEPCTRENPAWLVGERLWDSFVGRLPLVFFLPFLFGYFHTRGKQGMKNKNFVSIYIYL